MLLLARSRDLHHIPVGDVTMAHLVAFHPERDLVPMMLAHCDYSLEVGKGTSVHYNWLALERHLIDRFVKRRPLVDFKVGYELLVTNPEHQISGRGASFHNKPHNTFLIQSIRILNSSKHHFPA